MFGAQPCGWSPWAQWVARVLSMCFAAGGCTATSAARSSWCWRLLLCCTVSGFCHCPRMAGACSVSPCWPAPLPCVVCRKLSGGGIGRRAQRMVITAEPQRGASPGFPCKSAGFGRAIAVSDATSLAPNSKFSSPQSPPHHCLILHPATCVLQSNCKSERRSVGCCLRNALPRPSHRSTSGQSRCNSRSPRA